MSAVYLLNFFKKITTCVMLLLIPKMIGAEIVYILPVPGMDPLTQFYDEYSVRDECAKPFCKLREALESKGHQIRFIKGGETLYRNSIVISFNGVESNFLSSLLRVTSKKRFMVAFEPHSVMPQLYDPSLKKYFDKMFVMFDDYVDNKKYFKLHYPQPRLAPIDAVIPFKEKKFCALIAGNKSSGHPSELYSERVKIIRFFEGLNTEELDLYGWNWDDYKSWKGLIESKWETLSHYKFNICYENMHQQNGYVTEKIFDALIAKCVPVYWGASNITDYVPADCFVDRRLFSSDEELYFYLKNMDEATYQKYLLAGKAYLASPEIQHFSIESFVDLIMDHL